MGITYMVAADFLENVKFGDLLKVDYPMIVNQVNTPDDTMKISIYGTPKPNDRSKLLTKVFCGKCFALYLGEFSKSKKNQIKSRAKVIVTNELGELVTGCVEIVTLQKVEL